MSWLAQALEHYIDMYAVGLCVIMLKMAVSLLAIVASPAPLP